jgi:hypothetical protein
MRRKSPHSPLSFEGLEGRSLCSASPAASLPGAVRNSSPTAYVSQPAAVMSTAAVTATASPSGVYALIQNLKPIPSAILTNPNIDGVSLYLAWCNVERTNGVYDWSYLDAQISAARAAGKKVSLSLMAGVWTPNWVYSLGAVQFTYVGDRPDSSTRTIPMPWDSIYLREYTTFLKDLGARYGSNPAITDIKVTGVNAYTQETGLPDSTGQQVTWNGQTWTTTNDVRKWQNMGYTSTKVLNAYLRIAAAMAQAFPTKSLTGIFYPGGFPPIDANGNLIAGQTGNDQLMYDMINQMESLYGSRFVLQNDGLSSTWMWPKLTTQPSYVKTGAQMTWSVTNDPAGRMNGWVPGYDPATVLQDTVNDALAGGLDFLEIYLDDLQNPALNSVIASAHTGLTQQTALQSTPTTPTQTQTPTSGTATGVPSTGTSSGGGSTVGSPSSGGTSSTGTSGSDLTHSHPRLQALLAAWQNPFVKMFGETTWDRLMSRFRDR